MRELLNYHLMSSRANADRRLQEFLTRRALQLQQINVFLIAGAGAPQWTEENMRKFVLHRSHPEVAFSTPEENRKILDFGRITALPVGPSRFKDRSHWDELCKIYFDEIGKAKESSSVEWNFSSILGNDSA